MRMRTPVSLCWMALLSALPAAEGFQVDKSWILRPNMPYGSSAIPMRRQLSPTTSRLGNAPLLMSNEVTEEDYKKYQIDEVSTKKKNNGFSSTERLMQKIADLINEYDEALKRRPPFQVDDLNVLAYDIILIINLAVSISLWVVHRMDLTRIGSAFSEGCLMSLLWIGAGLFTGAFLNSAVDGHFGSEDEERGGPKGAGFLAFHTFINAINLRLLFALVVAVMQHRPVGSAAGEQLMPLEIGFGLILMIFWRALHSRFVPRF